MAENTNTPKSGSADSMLNAAAGLVSDKGAEKLKNQVKPEQLLRLHNQHRMLPIPVPVLRQLLLLRLLLLLWLNLSGEQVFGGKPLKRLNLHRLPMLLLLLRIMLVLS
jgi:hypothetical protein